MSEINREYIDQQIAKLTKYWDKRLTYLATKDDLKDFARKDDLKELATRDDQIELAKTSETKAIRIDILGLKDQLKEMNRDRDAYGKDITRHDKNISTLMGDVKRVKIAVGIK